MPTATAPASSAAVLDLTAPVDDLKHPEKVSHLDWAKGIARRIAQWKGLTGAQEVAEIESVAAYTLSRKLLQFEPLPVYADGENIHGHFRGWIHLSLRAECLREIRRLRGGGTFRTPRGERRYNEETGEWEDLPLPTAEALPSRRTDDGFEEIEIADHREAEVELDRCPNCSDVLALAGVKPPQFGKPRVKALPFSPPAGTTEGWKAFLKSRSRERDEEDATSANP